VTPLISLAVQTGEARISPWFLVLAVPLTEFSAQGLAHESVGKRLPNWTLANSLVLRHNYARGSEWERQTAQVGPMAPAIIRIAADTVREWAQAGTEGDFSLPPMAG